MFYSLNRKITDLNVLQISFKWFLKLMMFNLNEKTIIHCLTDNIFGFVFLALLKIRHGNNVVTIGTIHGFRSQLLNYPFVKAKHELPFFVKLSMFLLGFCDRLTADNENIYERYSKKLKHVRVHCLPVYIPFDPLNLKTTNTEIIDLKNFKLCFSRCIVLSIWAIRFDGNVDLYGVDLIMKAFSSLKKQNSFLGVGLIVHVCQFSSKDNDYLDELKLSNNIDEKDILFITNKNIPSYNLVESKDVFVRPTYTDGGPLSLYEIQCVSPGTIIIASDCAKRLEGVITFKNRSVDDLVVKLQSVLTNPQQYTNEFKKQNIDQYGEAFKQLYRDVYYE